VVAVDGPAVAESVRDGVDGLIVASPDELAGALVDLAASDERRGQLASAAAAGADRFDVARRIAEVASVYREV
jgi:glycosyltransferase involved in cell wall biosynthesis